MNHGHRVQIVDVKGDSHGGALIHHKGAEGRVVGPDVNGIIAGGQVAHDPVGGPRFAAGLVEQIVVSIRSIDLEEDALDVAAEDAVVCIARATGEVTEISPRERSASSSPTIR